MTFINRQQRFAVGLGIVITLAPFALSAHETWLDASQRSVDKASTIVFRMSSGEHFPTLQSAIDPNRVETASCRQGGAPSSLEVGRPTAKSLTLSTRPATRGALTCWVQLRPRNFDLALDKVEAYMKEIDAPEAARKAWESMPQPRRWNETYTKNAKVIVPMAAGPSAAAPRPVGLKLEFVPASDLSTGRLEGPLGLTVLREGRPLGGLAVALWSERKGEPVWRTSDAEGRVSFDAPSPGRWMVSGTDLRVVDARAGKWESQFSTLVFEILARQRADVAR